MTPSVGASRKGFPRPTVGLLRPRPALPSSGSAPLGTTSSAHPLLPASQPARPLDPDLTARLPLGSPSLCPRPTDLATDPPVCLAAAATRLAFPLPSLAARNPSITQPCSTRPPARTARPSSSTASRSRSAPPPPCLQADSRASELTPCCRPSLGVELAPGPVPVRRPSSLLSAGSPTLVADTPPRPISQTPRGRLRAGDEGLCRRPERRASLLPLGRLRSRSRLPPRPPSSWRQGARPACPAQPNPC